MCPETSANPQGVAAASQRTERIYVALISMILLLGVFLRLNRFLLNRSLWHDEALFALNILERTPLRSLES